MAAEDDLYAEGERLKDEGQYEKAIAKFNEVLAVNEQHALAHFALAVMYGKVGQHAEAVKHGQRGCELEPDDPFSYTALSVTCQRAFAGTGDQQYLGLAEQAMAEAHARQAGQW